MPVFNRMNQPLGAPLLRHMPGAPRRFLMCALAICCVFAAGLAVAAPPPAPMPARAFQVIDAVCDADSSETGPKGQFVCQYVCRDRDRTKLAVVYSNSGSGQCRSPISRKIKQYAKSAAP